MNVDKMIKYMIWVFFLAIALIGLYNLLKSVGVMG
jgi:hypothetical protein